jgi:hypothetical protein
MVTTEVASVADATIEQLDEAYRVGMEAVARNKAAVVARNKCGNSL